MILAYHVIISAYGFWLPNDPRGSWSDFVGAWELFKFGPATKTTERRSLAHDQHDREKRLRAKEALKFPPVRFDNHQRQAIANGFERAADEAKYIIRAGWLGYDHAHLVIERHDRHVEQIVGHLEAHATRELTETGIHPLGLNQAPDGKLPTPWSQGCWKVFIDNVAQFGTAIRYVERHPMKEGLAPQQWEFVRRVDA
jgi:REP element-mobilizing transposase RayT